MPDPLFAGRALETDSGWRALDPRRSLRVCITLAAAGASLAFTLLAVWVAGTHSRRQIEQQLGPSLENLAYQVVDKLDRGISGRYRDVQFAIGLVPLRTPGAPLDERRRLLESIMDASPEFAWLGFANPAGTVVFATRHQLEGTPVGSRDWFRNAREKPYAGEVHEVPELAGDNGASGGPSPRYLDLAAPVMSASGQFLGVLGAHVSWSLAREIQLSVISDTVAQHDHVGLTLYSVNGDALLDSGASGWNEPPNAPVPPDRRKSRGFFRETTPEGSAYLTGYAHSRGYAGLRSLGWLAVVRQPVADAFAPALELQRGILIVGLGFTAAMIVLSWALASRLTRRLRSISASARRIGGGDVLTVLPRPSGQGDLPEMCAALGGMVHALRQRGEELEAANTRLAARLHAQEKAPRP